ncbi:MULTISPECIES: hypothetical protein, partial [Streptomyces]
VLPELKQRRVAKGTATLQVDEPEPGGRSDVATDNPVPTPPFWGTRVGKGTIVLATVRGDVHDIGKNLVDIILSNNGYNVVNIGIKQPVSAIL